MEPRRFELRNTAGARAVLTNQGASLMALRVPDRTGLVGDVVLGFAEARDYAAPHPYLGATVGRVANRIRDAGFPLGPRRVVLTRNDGRHHLHGGVRGFGRRLWEAEVVDGGVRFGLDSPDGEEGYPGRLRVDVVFRLGEDSALDIRLRASTDRSTVVSLTQHAYFNLRDGGATSIEDHRLRLCASSYLPVDPDGIPTGAVLPVDGTPFDFRSPRRLGDSIDALGDGRGGYDHPFVVDGEPGTLRPAAELVEPVRGRVLRMATTLPGLQLYTGNQLDGRWAGRGGIRYARRSGVCLEAQGWPDAPNQPHFPSVRLEPGAAWEHRIVYAFVTDAATPACAS